MRAIASWTACSRVMPSAMARFMALAQKRSRFTSEDPGSPEALDYAWTGGTAQRALREAARRSRSLATITPARTIQSQSPENAGRRPVERHQLSSGLGLPRGGWRSALAALR